MHRAGCSHAGPIMACWDWADRWFGDDDVCDVRDKIGLIVGLISVACWALAEVPQLIVNAIEGSSDGLSEGLLWLWVFSDVLDVVGCTISDTLPTMLLTAWMYFIFTLLLLLQHVYYTHIRPSQDNNKLTDLESQAPLLLDGMSSDEDDLFAELYGPPLLTRTGSRHMVYGSLRNLSIRRSSSSSSLSLRDAGRRLTDSFLHRRHARLRARLAGTTSADGAVVLMGRPASADAVVGGLPDALRNNSLPPSLSGAAAATRMMAGLALLSLVALVCHSGSSRTGGSSSTARFLLGQGELSDNEKQFWGISYAVWGSIMGWTMAATFFLGRVPQVIKNWQRKSCAGLSVEMFVVVLTAAATYCASIIIRVRSWPELLPKLPFLTDAALGALLDIVILAQCYMYKGADSSDAGSSGEGGGKANGSQLGGREGSCSSKLGLLPGSKLTRLLGNEAGSTVSGGSRSIAINCTGVAAAAADVLVLDQARSDSDAQSILSIATI